jgi:putative tryptophan/tyrosine transport system substrate-binding protein
MKPREFIAGLGATLPLVARAQQAPKMLRVGTVAVQPRSSPIFVAFERRLAELGYEQGKNFALEVVLAASLEGFERGYYELAARHIDIVLAAGPEIALKSALTTVGALQP